MRRALVFGGSGFLGRTLLSALRRRDYEIRCPRHADVDVADAAAVAETIRSFRPDCVWNLAAAQPGSPEGTLYAANETGAQSVAEACAVYDVRLVHVSTDLVLDGRTPPYVDDAPRNALTPYGLSKAAGEAAVLRAHPDALCVRTSLLFDPRAMDRGTAKIAANLQAGMPCRLFTDEMRCPLSRTVLADALCDLAGQSVGGTLNVAGRERVSRHDHAIALLTHFRVPGVERAEKIRAADLERKGASPRPRDLSLVVARAESLLGRPLPGLTQTLEAHSERGRGEVSGDRSAETER